MDMDMCMSMCAQGARTLLLAILLPTLAVLGALVVLYRSTHMRSKGGVKYSRGVANVSDDEDDVLDDSDDDESGVGFAKAKYGARAKKKKKSRPQHHQERAHSPPERAAPAWHEDGDGACGLQEALQAATASVAASQVAAGAAAHALGGAWDGPPLPMMLVLEDDDELHLQLPLEGIDSTEALLQEAFEYARESARGALPAPPPDAYPMPARNRTALPQLPPSRLGRAALSVCESAAPTSHGLVFSVPAPVRCSLCAEAVGMELEQSGGCKVRYTTADGEDRKLNTKVPFHELKTAMGIEIRLTSAVDKAAGAKEGKHQFV